MKGQRVHLPGIRLGLIGIIGILLASACAPLPSIANTPIPPTTAAVTPTPIVSTGSVDPAPPINVKMILSKAPRLNEPADLAFVVSSIADAPATQVEVALPAGTQVLSGSVKWSGDLKASQPVTLKATIRFTQEGDLALEGKALSKQPNGDVWGDAAAIYLHVTQDAGSVGFSSKARPGAAGSGGGTPPAITPAP